MAMTVEAGFSHDLIELIEDLEAVEEGLSDILEDIVVREAAPVVAEMRGLVRYDPEHRGWRGRARDPGHIRDSIFAALQRRRGLVIRTSHPGGPVHWWGGSIAPRHHEIAIRKHPEAGEDFVSRKAEDVGRNLEDAIDRLLLRIGL